MCVNFFPASPELLILIDMEFLLRDRLKKVKYIVSLRQILARMRDTG